MPWGYAAAAVAGALVSNKGAEDAAKEAGRAGQSEIAFQQERYDDWLAVYGPIQENLGEYFNSLSAEYFEVQGLEAFEKERSAAMKQLNETLAQRGITDSGLAAEMEKDIALESAQQRAQIRTQAPLMAAQEQMRFLQVGMGLNPAESYAQSLANRAAQAQQTAQQVGAAAASTMGQAITTAGTALADYYNQPAPANTGGTGG